ncbi:MAG: hypothetical protein PHQ59_02150 [Candidatus Daviesbacteria bacterium]|nr:hypothetical protein [Candidatus Daviesbacteria bacterium]
MENIKIYISLIAIFLTFFGYVPYIRDTLKQKTSPHVYTWFIWGLVAAITFGLQVSAGAGTGSWVTLGIVLSCSTIFILGLRNGKKDITKIDTTFFILSLIALFLWLVIKQPVLSIILVSIVAVLGYIPTIRKSWNKPYSETLFSYQLNTFRHSLSFFALQEYSIITWLYPISLAIANGLFTLILIIRRKQLAIQE